MARPVRVVGGYTPGGGGKLVELLPNSPWLYFTGRALVWLVLHPFHVAAPAAGIACWVYTGWWWTAPAAAVAVVALTAVGMVAVTARRGSAAGLGAILSGMSRRRRLARRWDTAAQQTGLHSKGDSAAVPPLRDWRVTQSGVEAVCVTGAIGKHARAVVKASDDLAAACFADRVRVKVLSPSAARVRWDWGAHLGQTYRLPDLPAPSGPNRAVFGITEDGTPAELAANQSVLVGGVTTSGKSSAAWAILAGYIAAGIPIRVRFLDPGRMEFDAARKQLDKHGPGLVHQYENGKSKERLRDFWAGIDHALEARLDAVAKRGVREHAPTWDEPLDIVLIDELLPYANQLRKDGTDHTLGKVVFVGRKAGFLAVALTQIGQVDTLGRVRDLFPQRLCFRTMNAESTDAVLGGYAEENGGAKCSEIDLTDAGVGYAMFPGVKGYVPFRSAYVTDGETTAIAAGDLPAPVADRRAALEASPHVLYRYWGRVGGGSPYAGQLLYVGITNDLDRRHAEHLADDGEWMRYAGDPDVRAGDHYPNRDLALTAEALAIRREYPLFNKMHNGTNPHRIRSAARRLLTGAGDR